MVLAYSQVRVSTMDEGARRSVAIGTAKLQACQAAGVALPCHEEYLLYMVLVLLLVSGGLSMEHHPSPEHQSASMATTPPFD